MVAKSCSAMTRVGSGSSDGVFIWRMSYAGSRRLPSAGRPESPGRVGSGLKRLFEVGFSPRSDKVGRVRTSTEAATEEVADRQN